MTSPLSIIYLLLSSFLFPLSHAATLKIVNRCPYKIWAAAVPGGGRQLNRGKSWTINVDPGMVTGRVWPRTGCSFNESGHGYCVTGDCDGLLACQGYGTPPNTVVEFALNQYRNLDFFYISTINGFNVPMEFSPMGGCTKRARCVADINGQCPSQLRVRGGCNGPCPLFKTDQYCCNSSSCEPTEFSDFFKKLCPEVYSYPNDSANSTFTCPGGTDYRVTFCPRVREWLSSSPFVSQEFLYRYSLDIQ